MFGYRTTYYVAWAVNDGAICLSGLSFSRVTKEGEAKFDKIISANAYELETCTVPREGIKHWNCMTAEWLRHYVYERIRPKDGKDPTLATIGTNLVSAFWHGFYPVYYNTFFFLAIVSEIGKDVFRLKHLFTFIPSSINPVLRNLLVMTSLNYLCSGMGILEMKKAYAYYKMYYFYWHIVLIVSFIGLRFFLLPKFKQKKNKSKQE
eukprot:CAMPEP_0197012760 /NCGR_PEP_ID=MMETSP1380-20130617/63607_1 /TAXON_ID=5936 /ORGANISM="Euplotes crassus, Strain CT5" /LENGTH=205 /DNA_ID=CAMNT_0042436493 /DNA_START=559 /DNA_END=1176 /DNA_ORIENTATION=+